MHVRRGNNAVMTGSDLNRLNELFEDRNRGTAGEIAKYGLTGSEGYAKQERDNFIIRNHPIDATTPKEKQDLHKKQERGL